MAPQTSSSRNRDLIVPALRLRYWHYSRSSSTTLWMRYATHGEAKTSLSLRFAWQPLFSRSRKLGNATITTLKSYTIAADPIRSARPESGRLGLTTATAGVTAGGGAPADAA